MSESRLYESVIQPLTTENLQILQEQFKNIKKTSTTARIIKWLSEIPQNLGSGDSIASNPVKEGEAQNQENGSSENQGQQMNSDKPNKDEFNNPGKKNGNNNDYDRMKKMNAPTAANNATEKRSSRDKGRLCCYLKVEVGGNTQLLPIHENDIPQNLAYNFCKSNNILNSVNSLKEHIINAIENYMSKSIETINAKKKKKSKSKTKLNRNENSSTGKFIKSNENIARNKSKSKIKGSKKTLVPLNTEKITKLKSNSKNNLKNNLKSNIKNNLKSNLKSNESLKKKVSTKYLKNTHSKY